MKKKNVVDKAAIRAERLEDKAVRKLRALLIRIWFIKNWFTILVIVTVILLAFTVTGLMPENLPVIGTYSYALKSGLQQFLEIGDQEFYTLFGSITGVFSLLFSVGFASAKIKAVSYYMIDKDKIKLALAKVNLSLTDKGKIVSIENRIGIDLDGDKKIGNTVIDISESSSLHFLADVFGTTDELVTILKLPKATLREAIKENPGKDKVDARQLADALVEIAEIFIPPVEPINTVNIAEAVMKKPAKPIPIKKR